MASTPTLRLSIDSVRFTRMMYKARHELQQAVQDDDLSFESRVYNIVYVNVDGDVDVHVPQPPFC